MTIKKMLLLASMALAVVAFAAPAAAQAESSWSSDPGNAPLGGSEEEATTVTGAGNLATTASGVTSGPTSVDAHGLLWNDAEMESGVGIIDGFSITGTEFATSLSFLGCNVNHATNSTEEGAKWAVTLDTEGVVTIEGVSFTNHYNAACQKLGLPATASAHGTAEGSYNNGTGCIEYSNSGSLTTSSGAAVALNGEVCLSPEITAN